MTILKSNFQLSLHPAGGAVWNGNSFLSSHDRFGFAAPGYLIPNKMRNQTKIKNIISLEDVEVSGNEVAVSYYFNGKPLETKLEFEDLTLFAENRGMNEFIFDGFDGDHFQDEATQPIAEYMSENLNEVVLAYLLEYPLESVSLQLDAMVLRLTE